SASANTSSSAGTEAASAWLNAPSPLLSTSFQLFLSELAASCVGVAAAPSTGSDAVASWAKASGAASAATKARLMVEIFMDVSPGHLERAYAGRGIPADTACG